MGQPPTSTIYYIDELLLREVIAAARYPDRLIRAPRRTSLPSEYSLQMLQVVDHAPVRGAGGAHALLPLFEPPGVAPRIHVVGAELGDIERDDVDAGQVQRNVAHRLLVELLLHVGEDQYGLASRSGLVQELRRLQNAAGDVGVRAARLGELGQLRHLLLERAFLRVRLQRVLGERRFGDDVLLRKAAALDARDRQRIARIE